VSRPNPAQREACDQIGRLLQELAGQLGPRESDPDDYGADLDVEEMARLAAVTNPALTEWVVLMQWVDMDSGEAFQTRVNLPEMLTTHIQGLLMSWVD